MNSLFKTFFVLLLAFALSVGKKSLLKKATAKSPHASCNQSFHIINWGTNAPLYLYNIARDNNGTAKYADVAVDLNLTIYDKWCILEDRRIQHVDTGLYLNVHGPGKICWAYQTCEWATQIDAYYQQGTTYYWNDVMFSGYHSLRALDENRTITVYLPGGGVNLDLVGNTPNLYQLFSFHT